MSLGAIDFGLPVDARIAHAEFALVRIAAASVTTLFSLAIILLVCSLRWGRGGGEDVQAHGDDRSRWPWWRPRLTAFPALAAFVLSAPRRKHDGATRARARLGAAITRRSTSAWHIRNWSWRARCVAERSLSAPGWAPNLYLVSTKASCRSTSNGFRRSLLVEAQRLGDGGRAGTDCSPGGALGRHANWDALSRSSPPTPSGPDETEEKVISCGPRTTGDGGTISTTWATRFGCSLFRRRSSRDVRRPFLSRLEDRVNQPPADSAPTSSSRFSVTIPQKRLKSRRGPRSVRLSGDVAAGRLAGATVLYLRLY